MQPARAPRVTILIPTFPPWGGGGVIRMAKLAKYLPEFGWNVTVVCSDERDPIIRDDSLLQDIPPSVRIIRVKGPFNRLGGRATVRAAGARERRKTRPLAEAAVALGRSLLIPDRWIGWSAAVSRRSRAALGDPDVIISSGPPHSTHLAAARLSGRLGIPFVMDLRDDWASDPFSWNVAPWRRPIENRMEGRCLRRAAAVIVVSDGMRAGLTIRRSDLDGRLSLIPNGFDGRDFADMPQPDIPGPDAVVRFQFVGRLLAGQSAGHFYDAFGAFAGRGTRAMLRMTGQIDPIHVAAARAAIASAALTVEDYVPHAVALERMAQAHVLLVFILGGPGASGNMTGKLYEYLATGRQVLLIGPEGDAADLVRSTRAGSVARPDDLAGIGAAIRSVAARAREPARDLSPLASFDRRHLAGLWAATLGEVVGQAASPPRRRPE